MAWGIEAKAGSWFWAIGRVVMVLAALTSSLLVNSAAEAIVVEHLSTSTSYTYDFVPGLPGVNSGAGDSNQFELTGSDPARATDIKLNYGTVIASDASFFFLHNIQCQGYCSIGVLTTLTDTITNQGSSAVDLRFDSSITAGHLGLVQNDLSNSSGVFQFTVSQNIAGSDHQLYQALGQIASSGASITTSDGSVFNNLSSYTDQAQKGLDWDATDLSLLLDTLAPGQTTTLTYTSYTYLNSYGTCLNFNICDGVQVAFGDPRNNGGVFNLSAFLGTSSVHQPIGYVLNRGFDMATVKMDVVNVSGSVPEPGNWALMLVGFGVVGAVARRRRAVGHGAAMARIAALAG